MTEECVVCGKYSKYEFKFTFIDHSLGFGKYTSLDGYYCADCGKKRLVDFTEARIKEMFQS